MNEPRDLETALWSTASGGDEVVVDREEEIQLEVHRVLCETISPRPAPQLSAGFDASLAAKLARRPTSRPLKGWRRVVMAVYWMSLAAATLTVLWFSGLELPAPSGPLAITIWVIAVPLSYLPWLSPRSARRILRRFTAPLFT